MAEQQSPDLMGYEAMAQDALRGVVRAALERAASPKGLPGAHHLYISISTTAAGVSVPPDLLERYPEEITIVLQHQFWDLDVEDRRFGVTLKFGGSPKRLEAPYAAITRFYDPSVQFMLQFEAGDAQEEARPSPPGEVVALRPRPVDPDAHEAGPAAQDVAQGDASAAPDEGPKIVSLDTFRKK